MEQNLKDCGQEVLKCSDCDKPIMHYWIHMPIAETFATIQANCPFCKGKSFMKDVKGLFRYGPIGSDEPYEPTVIVDIIDDVNHTTNKRIFQFNVVKKHG